jgi:hypothetical protein
LQPHRIVEHANQKTQAQPRRRLAEHGLLNLWAYLRPLFILMERPGRKSAMDDFGTFKPCREHLVHSHFVLEICSDFERAQGHFLSLSYPFVLAGLGLPKARCGITGSK